MDEQGNMNLKVGDIIEYKDHSDGMIDIGFITYCDKERVKVHWFMYPDKQYPYLLSNTQTKRFKVISC